MRSARSVRAFRLLVCLSLGAATLPASASPVLAFECGDVHVIWARGSGQDTGADLGFSSFVDRDLDGRIGPGIVFTSYELTKINIWSARLAPGASTFGPEIKVTSNTSAGKQQPEVAVGTDGSAHAVWLQPNVGNADIWHSSLAPNASAWSTNVKVSDDPGTAYQGMADVGVDGAGNVMVVWDDWRTSPNQLRVRRKPAGGAWAASTVIAANGADFPSLAVRSDGKAYVAWYDGSNDPYSNIWGSLYDQSTGTWSAAEQIDDNGVQDGAWYAAAAIDMSKVVVVFQQSTHLQSGGADDDIMGRTRAP